jgi:hypothetical protein
MATDRALLNLFHAERVPVHLGNAIMKDLATAAGRFQGPKKAEDIAAISPWIDEVLARGQSYPALGELLPSGRALLLDALSHETLIALRGFLDYRARRR